MRFLRLFFLATLLSLNGFTPLAASASSTSTTLWEWLGSLFGRKLKPTPALERTRAEMYTNADGTFTVSEQYTARWTPDGNGNVDSLLFTATATGQVAQTQNVGAPIFPRAITVTWTSAAPGQSVTTSGCVKLKRRSLYSTVACSASRAYGTPDVPPPPAVIDTALFAIRIRMNADSFPAGVATITAFKTYGICVIASFGPHAGVVGSDPQCQPWVGKLFPLTAPLTAAEQSWADTRCYAFGSTQPRHSFSGMPNSCSVWTERWRRKPIEVSGSGS